MALIDTINADIKAAMLAREKDKLESLRAIKSALLLEATKDGAGGEVSEEIGAKVLQKLYKQRKESAALYTEQGREDLAAVEVSQAAVIEAYLPAQMSEDEIRAEVTAVIAATGATSMADMGKVMGMANGKMAGKADGKVIAGIVKELLGS
ncbi:MAG: GatB/YqeY domain-containing protein [Gammaproteobacteria bacterium]|nr:MAG: GatB/YqeY domain-containing protein [Gammaproteobacteria bacterium]